MPIRRVTPTELATGRQRLITRRATLLRDVLAWLARPQIDPSPRARARLHDLLDRVHRVRGVGVLPGSVFAMPRSRAARVRPLGLTALRTLHAQLRAMVDTLWPRSPAESSRTPVVLAAHVSGLALVPIDAHTVATTWLAEWPETIVIAIAHLIHQHAGRLRRCPARMGRAGTTCGQLFLRTRRQRFCSRGCGERERARTWYAQHRAAAQARRRATYEARKLDGADGHVPDPPRPVRPRGPRGRRRT